MKSLGSYFSGSSVTKIWTQLDRWCAPRLKRSRRWPGASRGAAAGPPAAGRPAGDGKPSHSHRYNARVKQIQTKYLNAKNIECGVIKKVAFEREKKPEEYARTKKNTHVGAHSDKILCKRRHEQQISSKSEVYPRLVVGKKGSILQARKHSVVGIQKKSFELIILKTCTLSASWLWQKHAEILKNCRVSIKLSLNFRLGLCLSPPIFYRSLGLWIRCAWLLSTLKKRARLWQFQF